VEEQGRLIFAMIAVGVAAVLGLILLAVAYAAQRGPRRAGLAPLAVVVALSPSVVAVSGVSWHVIQLFSELAQTSSSMAIVVDALAHDTLVLQLGGAAGAFILFVAAALGWWGRGRSHAEPMASSRRLAFLFGVLVLPPLIVGPLAAYCRADLVFIRGIVETPPHPPADEERPSAGSIAEISRGLARDAIAGGLGVPALLLALWGLGLAATLVGWRYAVPTGFAAASSLWLVFLAFVSALGVVIA